MSESTGTWLTTELDGKQIDIYEPARPADQQRVVLHLHGHSLQTLKDNGAFTAELERHGLNCVCPHGQRSWWLDILCREFDEAITPQAYLYERVVPFIAARWGTKPPAIGLTGISMGGQGALQLAYRRPREFPVVAAIAPAVDFHNLHGQGLPIDEMFETREAARQATATLQFHPLNWPRHQMLVCDPTDADWFEGADRLAMKLASMGVPFEADFTTSNGGHSWEYFERMAPRVIGFVAERLEEQSRAI
ncbi:MAG: alpha/beta hydrolase-fold protein [Planctomycetaceae bacterium]